MALAIRVVPTLHGEVAKKFEAAAKKVETNPGTLDYRKKAKVVKEYIQKLSCKFRREVLQTNDRSVCCRMCFPSGVHSFASPQRFLFSLSLPLFSEWWHSFASTNGFYSVYRRICFSEWHIVPQLCVQIKQSRVYSRKALAECKASRRLGKQMRGLYMFLLKPTLQQFFL